MRAAVGADVPIVATLDPHGNVSDLVVESVDIVVAERVPSHFSDDLVQRVFTAEALNELWVVDITEHRTA